MARRRPKFVVQLWEWDEVKVLVTQVSREEREEERKIKKKMMMLMMAV